MNWRDIAAVVGLCVGGLTVFLVTVVVVFGFYGAILGALGAAIYLAFKAITGTL